MVGREPMGDVVPVGNVPPPETAAAAPSAPTPAAKRSEKMSGLRAGLKTIFETGAAADASNGGAKPDAPIATESKSAPAAAADGSTSDSAGDPSSSPGASEAGAGGDTTKKPPPAADPAPDQKTAAGLAAIEKRQKKFQDDVAKAKADLELDRAQLARQKAEVDAKASSLDELKALARKPGGRMAVLEKLGLAGEDDLEVIAREAYANSKAGKADPKNKQYAEQVAKDRGYSSDLEELKGTVRELTEKLETREKQAEAKAFVTEYLDGVVKAIPTTPTLIGKLHATNPGKARAALYEIGARLEKENEATPTHAEVIAEFEKVRRAELAEMGVDVDAQLKPAAAAPPAPKTQPTLDVTSSTGTRPINGNPSRTDKLKSVNTGLKKLFAESE